MAALSKFFVHILEIVTSSHLGFPGEASPLYSKAPRRPLFVYEKNSRQCLES